MHLNFMFLIQTYEIIMVAIALENYSLEKGGDKTEYVSATHY